MSVTDGESYHTNALYGYPFMSIKADFTLSRQDYTV